MNNHTRTKRQATRTASPPRHRLVTLLRGVGALIALVAVVAGVPLLMIRLQMLPHGVPTLSGIWHDLTARDDGRLVAILLAAGIWLCWALFTLSLIGELVGLARRRPAWRLPALGAFQRPVAALVAAIAIALMITPSVAGIATAVAAPPPLPTASVTVSAAVPAQHTPAFAAHHAAAPRTSTPTTRHTAPEPPAAQPGYRVQRRDTLWGIAQRYLHDPLRYPEIRHLNPTMIGPDNEIRPGQVLTLPGDATGPGLIRPGPPAGGDGHSPVSGNDRAVQVRVRPGDTLSGIVQEITGDGDGWPQAFAANQGRAEPDGQHLTDPNVIWPGWTVTIPAPTHAPATPAANPVVEPPVRHAPATVGPTAPTRAGRADSPRTTTRPETGPTGPVAHPTRPVTPPAAPTTAATPADPVPASAAPSMAGGVAEAGPIGTSAAGGTTTGAADPAATAVAAEPLPVEHRAPRTQPGSPFPVAAFAGGGLLLAGGSATTLMWLRRRQQRHRRPGRTIAANPPGLDGMERAVLAAGSVGAPQVAWLDQALRSLAQTVADTPGGSLPDVIAAAMTDDDLTLVLATPNRRAPAPWRADDDGSRWHLRLDDPLPYDEARRESTLAPYPTLASVGCTADGQHWLLDLERIALASLTGDTARCVDLARFIAAELAHNAWSEMLQVVLVGFGEELVAANPQRLSYTDDLAAATSTLTRRLSSVTTALTELDTDVLDGRLHDIAADQWAPTVLLVAPGSATDRRQLHGLLASVGGGPDRKAVAVVLAGDTDATMPGDWQMNLDAQGVLTIPDLGLELTACGLPEDEAAPLAQLLAAAATTQDEPAPAAHSSAPWDWHADACGALTGPTVAGGDHRGAITDREAVPGSRQPAEAAAAPAPTTRTIRLAAGQPPSMSVLPLPALTYLERAATTATDLAVLAPTVHAGRRAQIEDADPDLDADLADWHDPACPRPKVRLLGCPRVGTALTPSRPDAGQSGPDHDHFHTEAVTLLATRGRGMLAAEFATLMWPGEADVAGKAKVRKALQSVRAALGQDPATRDDYLVSTFEGRVARYSIPAAVVDAELFRRLRARGLACGADGLPDLWAALELVCGPPFDGIDADGGRARGGWAWLVDSNARLDFEYQAMIVDTAHTVAVRHLGDGEPERAARAAHVALASGAFDDVPLLDLIAAAQAQDDEAAADAYERQLVANAGEEDLPPRTFEVLTRLRHRWRDRTVPDRRDAANAGR